MSEDWLSSPAIKETHKLTRRRWGLAVLVVIMVGVTTSWFMFEEHTFPRPRALGEVAFLFEVNTQELRTAPRRLAPQREIIQDQKQAISSEMLTRDTSLNDRSQRPGLTFSPEMNTSPPIPDLNELQRRAEATPPRAERRAAVRMNLTPITNRPTQTSPSASPPDSPQIKLKKQTPPEASAHSPTHSSDLGSLRQPIPQTTPAKRQKSTPAKEPRLESHQEKTHKINVSSPPKRQRVPQKKLKRPTKSPAKSTTKRPAKSTTKRPTKRPAKSTTKRPARSTTKRPAKSKTKRPTTKRPTTKRPAKSKTKRPAKSKTKRPTESPVKLRQSVMWDQAQFTLQVRAFRDERDAERFLDELDREWPQLSTRILTASSRGKPIYRVLLGAFKNRKEAKHARRDFTRKYGAQHKPFIKALR